MSENCLGNRLLALMSVLFAAAMAASPASAQATRTMKIIVPLAAGGGADILARVLAEQINRAQGVTVLVEN